MANERDLTIALRLVDQLSGPLDRVRERLKAFGSTLKQATGEAVSPAAVPAIDNLDASVEKVGETAARAGGLLDAFSKSTKGAADAAAKLDEALAPTHAADWKQKFTLLDESLKDVKQDLEQVGEAGGSGASGLQQVVQQAGPLLIAGAAVSIALKAFGEFKSGIERSLELTESLGGAFRVLDDGTISIEQLRAAVLRLSETYGIEAANIGKAASTIVTETTMRTREEVELLLDASARLSKLGLMPVEESAKLLSDVLVSYNKGAGDARRVTDLLFVAAKNAHVSVSDFAELLRKVGPLAQVTGVGIDEIGAALGALRSRGVGSQAAIYGLSTTLLALSGHSNEVIDSLRAQGVALDLNALKTKGLVEQLRVLNNATAGNDQARIALFGSPRVASAIGGLLESSAGELDQRLRDLESVGGKVDEVLGRVENRVDEKFARLKQSWSRNWTELGDLAVAALTSIVPDKIALPEVDESKLAELKRKVADALSQSGPQGATLAALDLNRITADAQASAQKLAEAFRSNFQKYLAAGGSVDLSYLFRNTQNSAAANREVVAAIADVYKLTPAQAGEVLDGLVEVLRAQFRGKVVDSVSFAEMSGEFGKEVTRALGSVFPKVGAELRDTALDALNDAAKSLDLTRVGPDVEKLVGFKRDAQQRIREVWQTLTIDEPKHVLSRAQEEVSQLLGKYQREVESKLAAPPALPIDADVQAQVDKLRSFVDSPGASGVKSLPSDVGAAVEAVKQFISAEKALRSTVRQSADDYVTDSESIAVSANTTVEAFSRATSKEVKARELAIEKLRETLEAANATSPSYLRLSQEIDRQSEALELYKQKAKSAADGLAVLRARQLEALFNPVEAAAGDRNAQADVAAKMRAETEKTSRELQHAIDQLTEKGLGEFERQRARVSQAAEEAVRKLSVAMASDPEVAASWTDTFDAIKKAADDAYDAIDDRERLHSISEVRKVLVDIERVSADGLPDVARDWANVNAQIVAQRANLEALRQRLAQLPSGTDGVQGATSRIGSLIENVGAQAADQFTLKLLASFDLNSTTLKDELLTRAKPILEAAKKALDELAREPQRAPELLRYLDELSQKLAEVKAAAQDTEERFKDGFSKGVTDRVMEFTDAWKRGFDLATRSINAFSSEASSAIADMATGVKREGGYLRSFLSGLAHDLAQIASDLLVRSLLGKLLGGLGGGAASINGPLPFTTSIAAGAVVAGGLLPLAPLRSYSSGGQALGPQLALIGDNHARAEAVVPLPGPGRGIPVEFPRGIKVDQAGTTIHLNFTANVQSLDPQTTGEILQKQARLLGDIVAHQVTSGTNRRVKVDIRGRR